MRFQPVVFFSLFAAFACASDQIVGNFTVVLDSPEGNSDNSCYLWLDLFACRGWSRKIGTVTGDDTLCSRKCLIKRGEFTQSTNDHLVLSPTPTPIPVCDSATITLDPDGIVKFTNAARESATGSASDGFYLGNQFDFTGVPYTGSAISQATLTSSDNVVSTMTSVVTTSTTVGMQTNAPAPSSTCGCCPS